MRNIYMGLLYITRELYIVFNQPKW